MFMLTPWRRGLSVTAATEPGLTVPIPQVQSVIQEVKERFRSHTMRSYRARFLRYAGVFGFLDIIPCSQIAGTEDIFPVTASRRENVTQ